MADTQLRVAPGRQLGGQENSQGFLIADSCPSFPSYEAAFRAFFYGDFSRMTSGQVSHNSATAGSTGIGTASGAEPEARQDFYLGPLRSVRPNRVAVAVAGPAAQAAALLGELGSLRHGPWWPPLDEVIATARGFYPGALSGSAAQL